MEMIDVIIIVIVSGLVAMGVVCFIAAFIPQRDIDEACAPRACVRCGTTEEPQEIGGTLHCVGCITKYRKSMGEPLYRTEWYGGCQK